MNSDLSRRAFSRLAGITVATGALSAAVDAPLRKLKIGHTGITWGNNSLAAVRDVSALGYFGFETFGNVLEKWDTDAELQKQIADYKLPLISGYCGVNLTDPAKKKDSLEQMARWGTLIRKNGGNICVVGPNGVARATYDFSANKANIVATLNECAKMMTDMGLTPVLHQHTGTCIETRDETYAVLDAADTRYLKFGPDIGQLQKGGSDPVKVVKDYLPLVRHMHLKDYNGGSDYLGYCPLGMGKVDIGGILDLVEKAEMKGMIMVELDPSRNMPLEAGQTARIAKAYLEKLGYKFRAQGGAA